MLNYDDYFESERATKVISNLEILITLVNSILEKSMIKLYQ